MIVVASSSQLETPFRLFPSLHWRPATSHPLSFTLLYRWNSLYLPLSTLSAKPPVGDLKSRTRSKGTPHSIPRQPWPARWCRHFVYSENAGSNAVHKMQPRDSQRHVFSIIPCKLLAFFWGSFDSRGLASTTRSKFSWLANTMQLARLGTFSSSGLAALTGHPPRQPYTESQPTICS